jgi:hypothetical protein
MLVWDENWPDKHLAVLGTDSIGSLTPPHCCACPKAGPGFQTLHVVISELKWEVIYRFVEICVIVAIYV